MEHAMTNSINRRKFIKMTGAGGVGMGITGHTGSESSFSIYVQNSYIGQYKST